MHLLYCQSIESKFGYRKTKGQLRMEIFQVHETKTFILKFILISKTNTKMLRFLVTKTKTKKH